MYIINSYYVAKDKERSMNLYVERYTKCSLCKEMKERTITLPTFYKLCPDCIVVLMKELLKPIPLHEDKVEQILRELIKG